MTSASERFAFWQRWHSYVLGSKGVAREADLASAIRHDLFVGMAAARTMLGRPATGALVDEFFADRTELRDEVMALVDEETVNHLGFRIHEPLDIWLEGLARWAPRLRFDVIGVKRFTASAPFRERVGAFVEMAQVWLDRDDTTIELELFDIHRPNPPIPDLPESDADHRALLDAATPDVLRRALVGDDIWHLGVLLVDDAAVRHVHERFCALVADDDRFRLRTHEAVTNEWHGSVHTKLTNVEAGTEIEFLSYRVDWKGSDRR